MTSRPTTVARLAPWLAASLLIGLTSCFDAPSEPTDGATGPASDATAAAADVSDAEVEAWRTDLLDLAYEGASRFPLEPHIKNRSRAQETLVRAAFDLQLPRRALTYAEGIANWRRGTGLAEYALVCARRGDDSQARTFLARATEVADTAEDALAQDWRRDTIRAVIAQAWVALGDEAQAARFEQGLDPAVWGRVDVLRAETLDEAELPARLDLIDQTFGLAQFDRSRTMLEELAVLYHRFYDDAERRQELLALADSSSRAVSVSVLIETRIAMIDAALSRGDGAEARALVESTESLMEANAWLAQDQLPLMAALAARRGQAGDREVARRKLEAALVLYDQSRDQIYDIDRADALRPVAEAFARMGDCDRALEVYARAVDEGATNPNARPRADDLAATICSLVRVACPPDPALTARLNEVADGLRAPW